MGVAAGGALDRFPPPGELKDGGVMSTGAGGGV